LSSFSSGTQNTNTVSPGLSSSNVIRVPSLLLTIVEVSTEPLSFTLKVACSPRLRRSWGGNFGPLPLPVLRTFTVIVWASAS
jgi:hypothetical protein